MTAKVRQLLDDAMALSASERADLAATLLESLDSKRDAAVDAAWESEVRRRMAELDRGEVRPVSGVAAFQKIRDDAGASQGG